MPIVAIMAVFPNMRTLIISFPGMHTVAPRVMVRAPVFMTPVAVPVTPMILCSVMAASARLFRDRLGFRFVALLLNSLFMTLVVVPLVRLNRKDHGTRKCQRNQ